VFVCAQRSNFPAPSHECGVTRNETENGPEARGLVGQVGQAPSAVVMRLPPFPLVGDSGCSPPRLQCLCRPNGGGENRREPRTDAVPRASTVRSGVGSLSSRRRAAPAARAASSTAAAGRGGGGCGAALRRAAAGCPGG